MLGKPAILIPSPNVAEDHQRKNAEALTSRGAAMMILDADAPAVLGEKVCSLIGNKDALTGLGAAAASLAKENSAEKIVDVIYSVVI